MHHQPDRQDIGLPRKQLDVCGKINLSLEHLRGVVVRRVMGSFFEHGAPAAPAPTEDAAEEEEE